MKSNDVNNLPMVICHYEDEPARVDIPELIESGLYETDNVTDSKITWPDSRTRYTITYAYFKNPYSIIYLVESNEKAMDEALASIGTHRKILHIVDMSLGSDKSAGTKIIENLVASGVAFDDIWMLTAYAAEALRRTKEMKINVRIISKPPNHRDIRDTILQRIADQIAADN
jgi:hypothetical protein